MDIPRSEEAERAVIGAILLEPSKCDDVATIVKPSDFYVDSNRRIYQKLLELNADSRGIDLALLVEDLRASGEIEEVGGEAYLGELLTGAGAPFYAEHYARIVAEKSTRRQLIAASESILQGAYDAEHNVKELLANAEESVFAVADARVLKKTSTMSELLPVVFSIIDKRANGDLEGVPTGFDELDKLLGGLKDSELIILAARPSMGKTALAANIFDYVAVKEGMPTIFFSLEMSQEELGLRMLCTRARLSSERLKHTLTGADRDNFHVASDALAKSKAVIVDSSAMTVSEIGSVARREKRTRGLALIIIDYLGLIEPDNPKDPRQEQVAKISRRLKGLARELRVPVLCLAQLNRQVEATKDNRPRLSHLRESGAIEQDADVVMFIHREEYYHTKDDAEAKGLRGVADVIVAKHRNGPVGDVQLSWNPRYTQFSNVISEEYSADFEQWES